MRKSIDITRFFAISASALSDNVLCRVALCFFVISWVYGGFVGFSLGVCAKLQTRYLCYVFLAYHIFTFLVILVT